MDDGLLEAEANGANDGDTVAGVVDVMQIRLCGT